MMRDEVRIRGLRLLTKVGVPEAERAVPQELRAHVTFWLGEGFPEQDDFEKTVCYDTLSRRLAEVAGAGERQLIETLAQELAAVTLREFPLVMGVRVELEKFILPQTDWVGVAIERYRDRES